MTTCKNCGQKTMATSDWACPWCGYPLTKARRLEKSYREIVAERRGAINTEDESSSGESLAAGAKEDFSQPPEHIPEEEIASRQDEFIPEPELAGDEKEHQEQVFSDEELCRQTFTDDAIPLKEESLACADSSGELSGLKGADENTGEQGLTQPVIGKDNVEIDEEEEPVHAIEITVEELLSAYTHDDKAAELQFNDSVLSLNGTVALVDVKEKRGVQYICLSDAGMDIFQSIKCLFNPECAAQLREIERGETITIRGRFKSSLTAMSLVDCKVV